MTEKPLFTSLIDLASEKLGGKALACSDDFFASMHNLIKPGRGVYIEGKYTENGKWMDGWESRRKRKPGHDWCIVQLGAPGVIRGLDVDTNHFLGNHPPHCSVDAGFILDGNMENIHWVEILPKSALQPGQQHYFEITNPNIWTHAKLHIYPDGGVARFKIYGVVKKDFTKIPTGALLDLAAAQNGGKAVVCNDMFFSHMDNLLMPGRGANMGDGWETKRNRTPNNKDWVVIRLAAKGKIKKIVVDTYHFKGNYPESCMLEGCVSESDQIDQMEWKTVLPKVKLSPHHEHVYEKEIVSTQVFTHVRLSIFPDGGVSRLRLWGTISN